MIGHLRHEYTEWLAARARVGVCVCVRVQKAQMAAFFSAIGLSATGPIVGGVWATVQSAAMGGAAAPAAALAMPIIFSVMGVGLLAAGAACVAHEYADAQKHSMGTPTTEEHEPKNMYVIVTHNWGTIEYREFSGFDEAIDAFRGGRKLRRILVRLNHEGEPDKDNGHGWRLPWDELAHAGCCPILDNGLRWNLLRRLWRA